MNPQAPHGHISVREAQHRLGIARQSMYHLIQLGRVPHVRVDGRIWIPEVAIEARQTNQLRLASHGCVSSREVAEFFGVDVRTVRVWHVSGVLTAVAKISNRLCFDPDEVVRFVPPGFANGRLTAAAGTRTLRGKRYPPPPELPNTTKGTQ